MKLYMIVLSTVDPAQAKVYSYVKESLKKKPAHFQADGFTVGRETNNCWFIDECPEGMPNQYRKASEYKLLNNRNGIYMYGLDSKKLIENWNGAVVA